MSDTAKIVPETAEASDKKVCTKDKRGMPDLTPEEAQKGKKIGTIFFLIATIVVPFIGFGVAFGVYSGD